jgi:uncharacterized protein (TIRG00374 family)
MAGTTTKQKKKKGPKHWALFGLRWGVAAVGVWLVVKNMSLHDQALVVLDTATNRPQMVGLNTGVQDTGVENAAVFPVIDPSGSGRMIDVPRARVLNPPDVKKVDCVVPGNERGGVVSRFLLGTDISGDLDRNPKLVRLLVADDAKTGPAEWILPAQAPTYKLATPYPRVQIGIENLVKRANPSLLWASLLVFPITFLVTSYRWNELLKALDIRMGQSRTFILNMVGCFYNSFLPGSTGGDAFKAYYASKMTPHRTRAVMSVLVDRAVGLLALIIVGGVSASCEWEIPACRKVAMASAALVACTVIGLSVFYNKTLHRLSGLDFVLKKLPMQKQVRGAVDAMHQYAKRPGLAIWSLIVSFPVHGAVVTSAMFAGMAFDLPLHWQYYWVAVPVIVLAGAIPISPQGAGVMEGFAILLTHPQRVTITQAVALTMSIRMVQILWNLAGGLFVLRGGFHAPNADEQGELASLPPEDPDGDAPLARELVPA